MPFGSLEVQGMGRMGVCAQSERQLVYKPPRSTFRY